VSNANVWIYRETLRSDMTDVAAIVGYDVEALDGDIGKIDKTSTETSRSYLVVDTGFWIFGKKRLIPAGVVTRIDHANRKVHVDMTKDQIKDAPDFDEAMTSYDEAYYDKYGSYYGRFGW
jgi:ribosomal 30S subunit maturation factor RimM